jgi:hypothetical protein
MLKKINPVNSGLGPRKPQSREQSGQQLILDLTEYQVSFDPQAFDNFIKSQGIYVTHYRAVPDPTGMASKGDLYAANSSRSNSDGFLFYKAGVCQILFTVNNKMYNIQVEGGISSSSAFATFPRYYDDGNNEVIIHPYDRLYLKDVDVKVSDFQFVEANSTGVDRLQYPAVEVEHLVDANGIIYKQDQDFEITNDGNIKWLTQKRPGTNIKINKGTIYSIRYRYVPFFVVNQLVHEIRISQVSDPETFDRSVQRMPYAANILRENVFHDTNKDPNKPISDQRYQDAPSVGGALGPK